MNFENVELARQAYYAKKQKVFKNRMIIAALLSALAIIIDIVVFLLNINDFSNLFAAGHPLISKIADFIPIFAILLIEIVFIATIVFFLTGGSSATREEYLKYKRAYKGYFITQQLSSFFTDLNCSHDSGLDKSILENTEIIYLGDRYSSNDLVEGNYKDVKFMQADVHLEKRYEERDEKGQVNVYYNTIFKGRFLVFEFPKRFDFKMVVSHKGYERLYINPKTGRGLSRIETESPEFNKRFLVYAEDGFEAFYILNPSFIAELEKLADKYNNNLAVYFSDNKLFVGLNDNNDAFEPPDPSMPINEEQEKAKVINDMKIIVELIEVLKLSRRD